MLKLVKSQFLTELNKMNINVIIRYNFDYSKYGALHQLILHINFLLNASRNFENEKYKYAKQICKFIKSHYTVFYI